MTMIEVEHDRTIPTTILSQYLSKTQKSKLIWESAKPRLPTGISRDSLFYPPYPSFAKSAKGSKITDVDGNKRIDFCFNFTSLILGHSHPSVLDAIYEQLGNGTVFGAPTELESKMAEEICNRVRSVEKVRFTVTGTEANMLAMRLARAFTKKNKIAKFEGAYHGSSDPASVSVHPAHITRTESNRLVPCADSLGLQRGTLEDIVVLPYNEPEMVEEIIDENSDELAAIIVEPVMRGIEPKDGFLIRLREIASSKGILLIFDEVITGFRLSRGGAQEKYHVEPDLSAFGKVIGGGFPIGAVGGRSDIMSLLEFSELSFLQEKKPKVPQSGTFNAHPISLSAGLATLAALTASRYQNLNQRGDEIRAGLRKILQEERILSEIYGVGSLFHIAFTSRQITDHSSLYDADSMLLRLLDLDMMNRGIYLAPGHFSCTSAVTSESNVNILLDEIRKCLNVLRPVIKERQSALLL